VTNPGRIIESGSVPTTKTRAPPKSTRQYPLLRVASAPPKRPYDYNEEENREIVWEYVQTQLHLKKPEPEPTYHPETIKWAKSMLNQSSQYELNKDDDYTSTL
jgi:hypothetical protein